MNRVIDDLSKIYDVLTAVYEEKNVKFWTDDNPDAILNEFNVLAEIGLLRDRIGDVLFFAAALDSAPDRR